MRMSALVFAGGPENIVVALIVVDAGQHEEEVRKPIEVNHHLRVDRFLAHQGDDVALRPPADGPCQVRPGGGGAAAGQDEAL